MHKKKKISHYRNDMYIRRTGKRYLSVGRGGLENVVFCNNYNYMDIIFLHHTTPHHTTPPQPKPLLTLQSDFHLYEIFAHTNPVIWHSIHSASYLLI